MCQCAVALAAMARAQCLGKISFEKENHASSLSEDMAFSLFGFECVFASLGSSPCGEDLAEP